MTRIRCEILGAYMLRLYKGTNYANANSIISRFCVEISMCCSSSYSNSCMYLRLDPLKNFNQLSFLQYLFRRHPIRIPNQKPEGKTPKNNSKPLAQAPMVEKTESQLHKKLSGIFGTSNNNLYKLSDTHTTCSNQ